MKDINQLVEFIRDNDVALVGNSSKLHKRAGDIDGHDLVVRMNRAWKLSPAMREHAGTKLDILCLSTEIKNLQTIVAQYEHTVWMTPKHRKRISPDITAKLYMYPEEWWEVLFLQLGARPSTGCMAFDFIRRSIGSGKITLYGFDFFRNVNWYTKPKVIDRLKVILGLQSKPSPHNWKAEEEFIVSSVQSQGFRIEKV